VHNGVGERERPRERHPYRWNVRHRPDSPERMLTAYALYFSETRSKRLIALPGDRLVRKALLPPSAPDFRGRRGKRTGTPSDAGVCVKDVRYCRHLRHWGAAQR
jgi:hypothetical protein